jgi:predicted DNA-binding protein
MVNRVNTLSIYIPKNKMEKRPVERLMKLSKNKERSINYLVVEAIVQYLDREEKAAK